MLRVAFALSFGLILAPSAHAQPMPEAAGQLASRISSLLPRRATVSLELRSLAARAPDGWSGFRGQLQDSLQKAGVEVADTTTQPDTKVRVTLAESAQGLLFVAEVTSGDNRQVAMLPWIAPRNDGKPRIALVNKLVWKQPEPVLDLLMLNSGTQMLVLSPAKLSSYQMTDGKWISTGTAPLGLTRPIPRDPRGRIQSAPDGFRVYVPGTTCTGAIQPALKLTCVAGNEPWTSDPKMRWITDRNSLESDATGAEVWGSDAARIENVCGAGSVVIASGAGSQQERDQVQAYEIADGQASAASEPLTLPGAVTALWPSESRGQVTLVVRNSQTGDYAASRLGVACPE